MDDKHNKPMDDYEAASQATAQDDYDEHTPKTKPHGSSYSSSHRSGHKGLIWTLVLLLVIAAGLGVYWKFIRQDKTAPAKNAAASHQASRQEENSTISSESKHYVSQQFALEFDYPADWNITDTTGSGKLVAVSPTLQLKDAAGRSFSGHLLFMIRNKQQTLPEFDKGNAIAAQESQKISYTKPSQVQRAATYISFLRYASSTEEKGLDGIYITGDVGYQKDQAIPKADFTPVDPVISLTFAKCGSSDTCSEPKAMGISTDVWQDSQFAKPLTTLLQSLTIN